MTESNYSPPITRSMLVSMYRQAFTIRRFEETGMQMYRRGNIRGYFHAYAGEEAIAVGACAALRTDDYILSTHRGHGHCIAKGADICRMMAELFGKSTGYAGGRGGSMHIADRATGNIGANGIVGAGIPLAAGVAMGIRQEGSDRVAVCFFGDGASDTGGFSESLNLAAIYKLPVIYILENNCYAATTHVSLTSACEQLSGRGEGYGVPISVVDGNDAVMVYGVVGEAVRRAREGGGPALIEAMTWRHYGHHVNDLGSYMPSEETADWKSRDPLTILRDKLISNGLTETDITGIELAVEREIASAVEFAESSPEPDVEQFLADITEYDNGE